MKLPPPTQPGTAGNDEDNIDDIMSMSPTEMSASDGELDSWKDPTRFEVFEYTELAQGAKQLEYTFDDLRGVSSLWFGVDGDEGVAGNSFGGKAGKKGAAMFGDWRLDESLVEEFEDEIEPSRSDKQEILKVVDSLLATCDENGVKERQGLEECAISLKKATGGNLTKRLDALSEQCAQRWKEEQEKTEAALEGLSEVEAHTVSRLESLAQLLKDRQNSVLADMKREREASKRRILACTSGDPHEENRLLFNKQLEVTVLEGKVKQRQHLLDITANGVATNQAEIEGAMLKAARDRVENLMQVVEKMQTQQTVMSMHLHSEKRKVSSLRLQISTRLRNSDKQEGRAIAANVAKSPKQVNQTGFTAMDVAAAASQLTRDEHDSVLRLDEDPQDVEDGGGEGEELDGAELLDACDRLEQDNLHLRERLAKIELHRLQREHESEQKNDTVDSRIAQIEGKKSGLQERLDKLKNEIKEKFSQLKQMYAGRGPSAPPTAAREQSKKTDEKELKVLEGNEAFEQHKGDMETEAAELEHKITGLRRQLVFSLACNVIRRKFKEAGMERADDMTPPLGPADRGRVKDAHEVTGDIDIHATITLQKLALKDEIARTAREELQIQQEIYVQTQKTVSEDGRTGELSEGGFPIQEPLETRNESEGKMLPSKRDSSSAAGIGQEADDPRTCELKHRLHMARVKLVALRALAEQNKLAEESIGGLDECDTASLEAVVRNEAIAMENAVAVLEILRSPAMEQARKTLLNNAVNRILNQQGQATVVAAEDMSADTRADDASDQAKQQPVSAVATDNGNPTAPIDTGRSSRHANDVRHNFTKADAFTKADTPEGTSRTSVILQVGENGVGVAGAETKVSTDVQGDTAPISDARVPLTVHGEVSSKSHSDDTPKTPDESLDDAGGEAQAGSVQQPVLAPAEDRVANAEHGTDAAATSGAVAAANQEEGEMAEEAAVAAAAVAAEERKACDDLLAARAEKHVIINDLRAKIRAAGVSKPRLSDDLRQRELIRIQKTIKAREKGLTSTNRSQEPTLEDLPVKMRREIINLRRQEGKLAARYKKGLEVVRKVLRAKGLVPETVNVGGGGSQETESPEAGPKPRKLTAAEIAKEKFLHSLTPQLERWRSRMNAMSQVLEEVQEYARREAERITDKDACMEGLESAGFPQAQTSSRTHPIAHVSLGDEVQDANLPGSRGSARSGRESPPAIDSASTAIHALALGSGGEDGLRSIGRVVKEAQHRRERVQSSERWVTQVATAEDGSCNLFISAGAKSPAGSRSPPQHSSRFLPSPTPTARHRNRQWPPLLVPSLNNKHEVFLRGTDELRLPGAQTPTRSQWGIPSPQPPSPDNNRRRKPTYAARTVGQGFSGFTHTAADGENQRSPQSVNMLGTSDDRSHQPAPSTRFNCSDQQQVTQSHAVDECDYVEEGLAARAFPKRPRSPLLSSPSVITPLASTKLTPQPPPCEKYVRQPQQMGVPAVQKPTAGVVGGATPHQQSPRQVLESPRSKALYKVGEVLGLTTPDDHSSLQETCRSHQSQQSRARSRSPPYHASETAMKPSTPGIGSPVFSHNAVTPLAAAVARALGGTDIGGVSGVGIATSPEPFLPHTSGNVPAIAMSPGPVGRGRSSGDIVFVPDLVDGAACPVSPRSGGRTGVHESAKDGDSMLVRGRYVYVRKDLPVTSELMIDDSAGSSQERSETTNPEVAHSFTSERDNTDAATGNRVHLYRTGAIVRDGRIQRPWEAAVNSEATSTLPTKVVNFGSFPATFSGRIASACVDQTHIDSTSSYQGAFVESSRSPSTGEGLAIRSAGSSVTSLQSLLTLSMRAPESVEVPPPLLPKTRSTSTGVFPTLRRPVQASEARAPTSLAHDGMMLFQLPAHISVLNTASGNPTRPRRSQQLQREDERSTKTTFLEMVGINVDGLNGDKSRTRALPNSRNYQESRGNMNTPTNTTSPRRDGVIRAASVWVSSFSFPDEEDDDKKVGQKLIDNDTSDDDDSLGGERWYDRLISPAILHRRKRRDECPSPLPSPKAWTPVATKRPRYLGASDSREGVNAMDRDDNNRWNSGDLAAFGSNIIDVGAIGDRPGHSGGNDVVKAPLTTPPIVIVEAACPPRDSSIRLGRTAIVRKGETASRATGMEIEKVGAVNFDPETRDNTKRCR